MKYLLCATLLCLLVSSFASPRKRIKLTKKGIYPDNPENFLGGIDKSTGDSNKGWLASPKIPSKKKAAPEDKNATKDKVGHCGQLMSYGIQCGGEINQCNIDEDCPGATKCCLVSDCGLMCVKPKALEKPNKIIKKRLTSADDIDPTATTKHGLKLRDITEVV